MGFLFTFIQVYIAYLGLSIQPVNYCIKGNVDQVNQYCEGARPTKETLGTAYQPKPYPNKKFFVIKGESFVVNKTEIIKTFSTNTSGDFSINLPKGTYSLFLEEQVLALNLSDYENKNFNIDTT